MTIDTKATIWIFQQSHNGPGYEVEEVKAEPAGERSDGADVWIVTDRFRYIAAGFDGRKPPKDIEYSVIGRSAWLTEEECHAAMALRYEEHVLIHQWLLDRTREEGAP